MQHIKAILKNLTLIFGSILLTVLLAELIFRLPIFRELITINVTTDMQAGKRFYYENDKALGIDIARNVTSGENVFFDASHPIFSNSIGCFDLEPEEASSPEYILLIGDSFTWGYAPFDKMWGTLLEQNVGKRVLKCGMEGSGTRHQLGKARKIIDMVGYAPSLIILGYYENDFVDDISFPSSRVIDGYRIDTLSSVDLETGEVSHYSHDEIAASFESFDESSISLRQMVRENSVIANLVWRAMANGPRPFQKIIERLGSIYHLDLRRLRDEGVPWVGDFWRGHLDTISELAALASDNSSDFLIVLIPSKGGSGVQDTQSYIREQGYNHIDVATEIERHLGQENFKDLYWQYNGHWNELGNEFVALLVAEHVNKRDSNSQASLTPAATDQLESIRQRLH